MNEQKIKLKREPNNPSLVAAEQELSREVEQIKDDRLEERFLWVVVCILLFDCIIFRDMENISGPIVIGIIELILIIGLARRLGVEPIAVMLSRLLDRIGNYPDGKHQ